MKFLHLSDLHLGKRVNEYSMLEDQEYILNEILSVIESERPEAVIIAGDVYDKPVPPAEAVMLFDGFLTALSERKIKVFIISGNHDSAERMSFGARLMEDSGIYISGAYNGKISPVALADEYGSLNLYMLPFIKPANIRRFTEEAVESYTDAVRVAIKDAAPDFSERNILITHQFVTGASRTDSEEITVGGTDNVDASVFEGFDYVALGHIHRPQSSVSEFIRYCGSPLKYSFSEAKDKKSVTVIEMSEKGNLKVRCIPLKPLRDMVELKGEYNDLMQKSFYENTSYQEDYTHITLTDEEDVIDAIGRLRTVYHNLMKLDYDNQRTRSSLAIDGAIEVEMKSPMELFSDFYELQNNSPMSDEQKAFMEELIEKIWEGER